LVSLALKQLLEAGAANVIPSNSDKLLSKIDIPDIPNRDALPWRLGEITPCGYDATRPAKAQAAGFRAAALDGTTG
jgi:hypothetical protein